jgi:uncharacterized membrane protein YhaH (DUF805 family)
MGPLTAIASCYMNMLNFSGRARRAEYWWFALFLFLIGTAVQIGLGVYFARDASFLFAMENPSLAKEWFDRNSSMMYIMGYAYAGYIILAWLPQLAVTVRRLHDTGRSGLFIFMPAVATVLAVVASFFIAPFARSPEGAMPLVLLVLTVPLIASIWFFVVLCLPGDQGNNRFGGDPAPDRERTPPAHPAFARTLPEDIKDAVQARNKSDFDAYYRARVAPAIQQNKTTRSNA